MTDRTSTPPRPKGGQRSSNVRTRSPANGEGSSSEARPPTKRARKAINCEPCRNSKLKCDRNRPCSSCVLRGTAAMCYQDGRVPEGREDLQPRCDPGAELARVRHSLSLLENYIFPNQPSTSPIVTRRPSNAHPPKREPSDQFIGPIRDDLPPADVPGLRSGGLYQGPTSAAVHLVPMSENRSESDGQHSRGSQEREGEHETNQPPDYDRDLLALLPPIGTIDGLINFYFDYCNWVYRHVHQNSFMNSWTRYKNGQTADHLILSTACVIMAVASRYLPYDHPLLEGLHDTHEGIGNRFYEISGTALQRRQAVTRVYNLELVELLLIRGHYLTMLKNDSEEIWHIRGELCTIGVAMGLHRDPGKWRMHRDVAERRRWAWWHIILFERWQAFMFGRPLAIAAHHYDTQLPSYCDPSLDKTGRLYLPNIALFQLAHILADVIDDAVSVRQIPYESVQANDRALTRWMENLPPELDMDEYRVARSLASLDTAVRRLGVQSVIIRASYYHIRFTLHRPYAAAAHNMKSANAKALGITQQNAAISLETAVSCADKVIAMVSQSSPDFLANSSLAVPGHMNWGAFHCFSAAMMLSFQLIANPEQPGAGLFRQSVGKAISTLELSRGTPLSEKALDILQTLAPLYSPEFLHSLKETRERQQAQILGSVRSLAFPYHDSRNPRQFADSPNIPGIGGSPANSSSVSPPMHQSNTLPPPHAYDPAVQKQRSGYYPATMVGHMHQPTSPSQMSPGGMPPTPSAYHPMPPQSFNYGHNDSSNRYSGYGQTVDESWGANIGINAGEWNTFMENCRPEPSAARHLVG